MTRRPVVRRLLGTVAAVVALVLVTAVADDHRRLLDLTEDEVLTLAPQTGDVLASIDRDIDITLFARPSDPGRVEVVSLLDRYRRLARRIDVDVRDPDLARGEAARAGIDPAVGGAIVQAGARREVVAFPTEGALTGAIARLLRDEPALVCTTTGHGERALDDLGGAGLSRWADLLARDGYTLRALDLLTEPEVHAACTVLVIGAPSGAMGASAQRAIGEWVDQDGRLLLLTDPITGAPVLTDVLEEYGIRVEPGIVLEGDATNVVSGDVAAPIVTRYPSASPVTRDLAPTFFPVVQGLTVDPQDDAGASTTTAIATTSETSYLERDATAPEFDPDDDQAGPVVVAATVDRSRVDGPDIRRTRVVVVGDVDFASNDFIGEAGNAQMLRQSVAWLAETEDLLAISPNLPSDRPLRLTDARLTYARLVSVGGVPALFVLAGALVWALRRGR
jgi:ABC-type uncharacterized transport system involved in gliding motility auxiliary subunit